MFASENFDGGAVGKDTTNTPSQNCATCSGFFKNGLRSSDKIRYFECLL